MKKSIFKAYWLVALTICMLASCTSQKEEIETNNTTPNEIVARKNVRSRSTLPPVSDIYDLPAYIGALHNASMYAFVEYAEENGLNPYVEDGFSNEMVETFAHNYVTSNLCAVYDFIDVDMEVSTHQIEEFTNGIIAIISNETNVNNINDMLQDYASQYYELHSIEAENTLIFEVLRCIAISSNVLWGSEWDFTQLCFDYSYFPQFISRSIDIDNSGNNNNNNNTSNGSNQPKSDEDLKELKEADIEGAKTRADIGFDIGVAVGTPTVGGMIVSGAWGALIGAAVGATIGSIIEYVEQEVEEAAIDIPIDYILPHTYLYQHLFKLRDTNPNKYFELYGNKFEEIFG